MNKRLKLISLGCLVLPSILFFAAIGVAQTGGWRKMGVLEGKITAIHRVSTGYFVGTAGAGVYFSADLVNWGMMNDGLEELDIVGITSSDEDPPAIYCATSARLYLFDSAFSEWSPLPPEQQLSSELGYAPRHTCLLYTRCTSSPGAPYLYVGTYGAGVWRLSLNPPPPPPLDYWTSYPGTPRRILSLASFEDRVFMGVAFDSADSILNPGGIWNSSCLSDTWYLGISKQKDTISTTGISWPALACHRIQDSSDAILMAGSDGIGIAVSMDLSDTFSALCSAPPPPGRFQAIDFYVGMIAGEFFGLAGSEEYLYCLSDDPRNGSCANGYHPMQFNGSVQAIAVASPNEGLIGTSGKGLFQAGGSLETICEKFAPVPVGQIVHRQVNEIVFSSAFVDDKTMFLASRSEGLYKSKGLNWDERIEFTRYFCNPLGYGPLDILSIALIPGYDEIDGSAWSVNYSNAKTMLLGSNGFGVFISRDGGASWETSNGGAMPPDAVVTAIKYSPGAVADGTVFAAVWNRGVYLSSDYGRTWSRIQCVANQPILVHDLAVSPHYPTDHTVWAATDGGLIRIYLSSGIWVCANMTSGQSLKVRNVEVAIRGTTSYVYMGTDGNGILRGRWNQPNWTLVQLADSGPAGITTTARIGDLKCGSFTFLDNSVALLAIKLDPQGDQLYYCQDTYNDSFPGWTQFSGPTGISQQRFTTINSPDFRDGLGTIFLGHAYEGIFIQEFRLEAWQTASGYFSFPHQVTSTAVDPMDDSIVVYGTPDLGAFISYDGGETACPFGRQLDSFTGLAWESVTQVTNAVITGGYTTLASEDFDQPLAESGWTVSDFNGDGYTWFIQADGSQGYESTVCNPNVFTPPPPYPAYPYVQVDSDCAGASHPMNQEELISPVYNFTNSQAVLLEFEHYFRSKSGNESARLSIRSSLTSGSWSVIQEWFTTTLNSQHEFFDISAVARGATNVQIKFSYLTATSDYYWFIDSIRFWGSASNGNTRNVVLGTATHGIYTISYDSAASLRNMPFNRANSPTSANDLLTATISKLLWRGGGEDMWAAASLDAALNVQSAYRSANFGQEWLAVSTGFLNSTKFSDIAYGAPMIKGRSSRNRSGSDAKSSVKPRDQTVTMWGCSSGSKTGGLTKNSTGAVIRDSDREPKSSGSDPIAGAYRYNGTSWSLSNGSMPYNLSEELYYFSIGSTSSNTILVSSWLDYGAETIYSGVWRSEDNGASWIQSSAGLPALSFRKIGSFLETEDGNILATLVSEGTGGVYMSDSDGYAWVRIDGFPPGIDGVNEVSKSTLTPGIYFASMSVDGSKQSTEISYTEDPVPEFVMNDDPRTLVDQRYPNDIDYGNWAQFKASSPVTFTSKSAGRSTITSWEWDFNNDGLYEQSGETRIHTFSTGGIKTVTLRLNGSNTLKTSHKVYIIPVPPPPIPDGTATGQGMQVSKPPGSDGSTIQISYDPVCQPVTANIIHGGIDQLSSYILSGSECDVGPTHSWNLGSLTNIWFVIVSDDGAATEGSWGQSSTGERNPGVASGQCGCSIKESTGTCP